MARTQILYFGTYDFSITSIVFVNKKSQFNGDKYVTRDREISVHKYCMCDREITDTEF